MVKSIFQNAVIRVSLKTAICVHPSIAARRMCLDAILAGQLYERTGDGPGAVAAAQSCLDQWSLDDDTVIPKASQVIFQGPVRSRSSVPFTRSIFRVVADPEIRQNIAGVRWDNNSKTLQRPFQSEMRPPAYEAIDVDAVYFLFRGDIGRVESAFRRATRIGALRAKGGGEIDSVTAEAVPNRSAMFGIVCGGRLMRPVPARCEPAVARLGDIQYHNGIVEAWHAPYHAPESKELCLVPVQIGSEMVLEMAEIAELLR
jgi:hypothetical protein